MFVDLPQELIFYTAGALLFGWLMGSISTRANERIRAKRRDPRDKYILELEAKLRIAEGNSERSGDELSRLEEELKETTAGLKIRDSLINEQIEKLEKTKSDLKNSVIKTHELRAELADRAAENVQAEARIREVETELSIAHASTDLLATGALHYTLDEDDEDAGSTYGDISHIFSRTAT